MYHIEGLCRVIVHILCTFELKGSSSWDMFHTIIDFFFFGKLKMCNRKELQKAMENADRL